METLNGAERNKGRFLGDGSTYLHIQEKGRRCIRIYQFLKIHLVVLLGNHVLCSSISMVELQKLQWLTPNLGISLKSTFSPRSRSCQIHTFQHCGREGVRLDHTLPHDGVGLVAVRKKPK